MCVEGNLKMKRTGEKKKLSSSKLKTDRDHAGNYHCAIWSFFVCFHRIAHRSLHRITSLHIIEMSRQPRSAHTNQIEWSSYLYDPHQSASAKLPFHTSKSHKNLIKSHSNSYLHDPDQSSTSSSIISSFLLSSSSSSCLQNSSLFIT